MGNNNPVSTIIDASSQARTLRYAYDVVIIDDFQALADQLADSFRRSGMVVQVALNGASALAIAEQCDARVALVDCALPDIDGLSLIPKLRAKWPDTIFIVMSGQVGGLSEVMARQLGVHAFINKPVPVRPMRQAVERLVRAHASGQATGASPSSWLSLGMGSPHADADAKVIRLLT